MKNVRGNLLLYRDIEKILAWLTIEQAGWLFNAIGDYAHRGTSPKLEPHDELLDTAWSLTKDLIDSDKARYELLHNKHFR